MKDLQNTNPPLWVRLIYAACLLMAAGVLFAGEAGAEEITIIGDHFVLQADVLDVQEGPNGLVIFIGKDDVIDSDNGSPSFDCDEPDFGPVNPEREKFCGNQ